MRKNPLEYAYENDLSPNIQDALWRAYCDRLNQKWWMRRIAHY